MYTQGLAEYLSRQREDHYHARASPHLKVKWLYSNDSLSQDLVYPAIPKDLLCVAKDVSLEVPTLSSYVSTYTPG